MNILIVSPAYPPFSGVGALRMSSLSSFLKNNGEQIYVLRNAPTFWGKENLKATVPEGLEIVDVNPEHNFNKSAETYVKAILKLTQTTKIDIIIYSVGPFYSIKVAPRIKKITGVKYILDFRDLWAFEKLRNRGLLRDANQLLRMWLNRPVEKIAVKEAERVVVVTEGDNEIMSNHYKKQKHNITTIFNGFERTRITKGINEAPKSEFTLSIFGKFGYYSPTLAYSLMEAVNLLRNEGLNICIKHFGEHERCIDEIIKKSNFDDYLYYCSGYVSYEQGMNTIIQSNINAIVYNHPTGLGTKVFDYISSNKPIILVTEHGEALSKFIKKFKNAYLCRTTKEIVTAINDIISNDISNLDEEQNLMPYSRERQNEKYYEIIKGIALN